MAIRRRAEFSAPIAWAKGQVQNTKFEIDWSHPLARGLQSLWLLNNGAVLDLAGKNPGTLGGGPTFKPGPRGSVLTTNGTGFINVGSNLNLAAVTIVASGVIATAFANAYNSVFTRSAGSGNYYQLLVKSTGKLALYSEAINGSYDGTGSNTLAANQTYNLAAVFDAATGIVGYVNGAVDGTAPLTVALNTTAAAAQIGSDPATAGRVWSGQLGPVAIYNRGLSAAEVAWLNLDPLAMLRPVESRSYAAPAVVAQGGTPTTVVLNSGTSWTVPAGSIIRRSVMTIYNP